MFLRVERLLVAAAEAVGHAAIFLIVKPGRLAQGVDQRVEPGRRAGAEHGQLVLVVEPADHVEVDHHHRRGERDRADARRSAASRAARAPRPRRR